MGLIKYKLSNLAVNVRCFAINKKAEGYLDLLIKILIIVIVGALLLGLMRIALPDLFSSMMDKIKNVFSDGIK